MAENMLSLANIDGNVYQARIAQGVRRLRKQLNCFP